MAWGITGGRGGRGVPKIKRQYVRRFRRKLERVIRLTLKREESEIEIDPRERKSAKWNWL